MEGETTDKKDPDETGDAKIGAEAGRLRTRNSQL